MLKKLALDQTKIYEKYIAMEEISVMLERFVKGRSHHLSIGAEQGDVDQWDDLVIQTSHQEYTHIQVKKQTTDFSEDSIIRDKYSKGKRKDQWRDLSAFDKAIKSLGEKIVTNGSDPNVTHKNFCLVLPEGSIQIKRDLEIRHLRTFCEVHIKDVTTTTGLYDLAQKDITTQNIFEWLTTWCGFKDWEHILKALKVLKINQMGHEVDIIDRTDRNLQQIFIISKIQEVRRLILSYLDDNATFTGAIKPRQLLFVLEQYLDPSVKRWTLFQKEGSSWKISGIHDLKTDNQIERADVIVPALWSEDNKHARSLKMYGNYSENCQISSSLMRLSLHPQGSFDIYCNEKLTWEPAIKTKIGGTLGASRDDLRGARILDESECCTPMEFNEVKTIGEKDAIAEKLHSEMHKVTLKLIDENIQDEINKMSSSKLRTIIDERWRHWNMLLEQSVKSQKELFSKILHPKIEGDSISGELRVGPKTATILSDAIFMLLVISACLGDNQNADWTSVADNLKMTSIGLAYWSGPADGAKNVIKIDEDPHLCKLIENEMGQIIIIAQSSLSEAEIYEYGLFNDSSSASLMTHPSYPKLLITQNRTFKRILAKGDIVEMKKYLQQRIDTYNNTMNGAVNLIVDGVIV